MVDENLPFEDREDAAKKLLSHLTEFKGQNPLVLGIPRGAIPMAKIIADGLGGEFDMILVKKIGHPLQPEFAIGSVTEDGEVVLGLGAREHGISEEDVENYAVKQVELLHKQRRQLGKGRLPISPKDRIVIVVDDGIATGATMTAAVQSLRHRGAKRIIVAAPVASPQAVHLLEMEGVEVRTVAVPDPFGAVGYYYRNFSQVSDAEVGALFSLRPAEVDIGPLNLKAIIGLPENPIGLVVFAHGSGSGRLSPRNQFVAESLNRARMATVLADLLTEKESENRANVFDIALLARRLNEISSWALEQPNLVNLKLGYFGASTGAGAALVAAAIDPARVRAVVSRGGRPDLAGEYLARVQAPTLLIVGGNDVPVIDLNRIALDQLRCEKKLEIVPGATHLFEEPGTLERVAELAMNWFKKFFGEAAHLETATPVQ